MTTQLATTSPPTEPFTLTEEQQALTSMVRDVLADTASSERVRQAMLEDGGFDATTWEQLAQLGLTGLTIAEEHGGAGASFLELSVVFEELGRRLAPVPLLSSVVLGATAVQHAGTAEQQAELLPGVAAGTTRLALAHLDAAGRLTADPGVRAVADGDTWTLDGTAGYVIDGASASHLVVAATSDDGLQLFVLPADAAGIEVRPLDVLDLTRPMATLVLSGVEADAAARLDGGDAGGALHAALTAGVVALACEQVGGTREVLETTTAYARDRVQFGRSIGSFQAVKHKLAELLVATESARSAAYHAARMVAAGETDELRVAAPLAASYCAEVYERAAGDSIQLHGGIGFTWEHDAHLYFKRAKASKLLLGSPKHHRALLADALGL
jgi:alkylation response protein AidB-like acyl-CoA dehydrogenase